MIDPDATQIRIAGESDIDLLDWTHDRRYVGHLLRLFRRQQRGETLVLIADRGDEAVARLVLDFADAPDEVWVYALEVKPRYRRQGVASALMISAEQFGRQWQRKRICLTVAKANESAQALYRHLGYQRVGEDISPGLVNAAGQTLEGREERWVLERGL